MLHQQQQQQHVPPIEQEHTIVNVMDHYLEQDLPSSFMFQDSDELALSNAEIDLMQIFDGSSFEDNIDLWFNTDPGFDSDINISEVLEGINCGGLLNGDAGNNMIVDGNNNNNIKNKENKEILSLNSSSSSSLSSTTTIDYL